MPPLRAGRHPSQVYPLRCHPLLLPSSWAHDVQWTSCIVRSRVVRRVVHWVATRPVPSDSDALAMSCGRVGHQLSHIYDSLMQPALTTLYRWPPGVHRLSSPYCRLEFLQMYRNCAANYRYMYIKCYVFLSGCSIVCSGCLTLLEILEIYAKSDGNFLAEFVCLLLIWLRSQLYFRMYQKKTSGSKHNEELVLGLIW